MASDSIITAFIHSGPNSKDFAKKKRANRSAKLKQCKLNARREQWISQCVSKNKNCKEETNRDRGTQRKERNCSLQNLETRRTSGEEKDALIHRESDTEYSPSDSPTSMNSSVLTGMDSGTNYTGSSSSSSSSGGCCSGSVTEEEEEGGDDGCLDDWEAVADALAADDKQNNHCLESPPPEETIAQLRSNCGLPNGSGLGVETSRTNSRPECTVLNAALKNSRAWGPDDEFRPQSLPNLAKQHSFPNSDRHYRSGGVPWGCKIAMSLPSSCPICYEDLDFTDTSFLPCLCGFRLCLFCHKRIMEEDGRCPGCRKPYEQDPDPLEAEPRVHGGSLTFQLARSCSMFARS